MVLAIGLGLSGLRLLNVPGMSVVIVVALAVGLTALLVYIGQKSWTWRSTRRARADLATEPTDLA